MNLQYTRTSCLHLYFSKILFFFSQEFRVWNWSGRETLMGSHGCRSMARSRPRLVISARLHARVSTRTHLPIDNEPLGAALDVLIHSIYLRFPRCNTTSFPQPYPPPLSSHTYHPTTPPPPPPP